MLIDTEAEDAKHALRKNTFYPRARKCVTILSVLAGLSVILIVLNFPAGSKGSMIMLVMGILKIIGIVVGHSVVQAIFDAADLAFQAQRKALQRSEP